MFCTPRFFILPLLKPLLCQTMKMRKWLLILITKQITPCEWMCQKCFAIKWSHWKIRDDAALPTEKRPTAEVNTNSTGQAKHPGWSTSWPIPDNIYTYSWSNILIKQAITNLLLVSLLKLNSRNITNFPTLNFLILEIHASHVFSNFHPFVLCSIFFFTNITWITKICEHKILIHEYIQFDS